MMDLGFDPFKIFKINSKNSFKEMALAVFNFQYAHNRIYHHFCNALDLSPKKCNRVEDIPFIPTSFFKRHKLVCFKSGLEKKIFYSSGTTQDNKSKHYVYDLELYKKSCLDTFNRFYGDIKSYTIFALVPEYNQTSTSSLSTMLKYFIDESSSQYSGFYLNNMEDLERILSSQEKNKQKSILFGLSYALFDFSKQYQMNTNFTTVIETGGMKGKRKELVREELHSIVNKNLGVSHVQSEYGMAELLSQAYASANGQFYTPPWMKVFIRDTTDPLCIVGKGKAGGVNIIDLANLFTCAFIATDDLGIISEDNSFRILGRLDHSELRGCNLLYPPN